MSGVLFLRLVRCPGVKARKWGYITGIGSLEGPARGGTARDLFGLRGSRQDPTGHAGTAPGAAQERQDRPGPKRRAGGPEQNLSRRMRWRELGTGGREHQGGGRARGPDPGGPSGRGDRDSAG